MRLFNIKKRCNTDQWLPGTIKFHLIHYSRFGQPLVYLQRLL